MYQPPRARESSSEAAASSLDTVELAGVGRTHTASSFHSDDASLPREGRGAALMTPAQRVLVARSRAGFHHCCVPHLRDLLDTSTRVSRDCGYRPLALPDLQYVPDEERTLTGELHVADVLQEVFLFLPLQRTTLVAVSSVSRAWRFYCNVTPQWSYVLPLHAEAALIAKAHVSLRCSADGELAEPSPTPRIDAGAMASFGTAPGDAAAARRGLATWWEVLAWRHTAARRGEAAATSPSAASTPAAGAGPRRSTSGGRLHAGRATEDASLISDADVRELAALGVTRCSMCRRIRARTPPRGVIRHLDDDDESDGGTSPTNATGGGDTSPDTGRIESFATPDGTAAAAAAASHHHSFAPPLLVASARRVAHCGRRELISRRDMLRHVHRVSSDARDLPAFGAGIGYDEIDNDSDLSSVPSDDAGDDGAMDDDAAVEMAEVRGDGGAEETTAWDPDDQRMAAPWRAGIGWVGGPAADPSCDGGAPRQTPPYGDCDSGRGSPTAGPVNALDAGALIMERGAAIQQSLDERPAATDDDGDDAAAAGDGDATPSPTMSARLRTQLVDQEHREVNFLLYAPPPPPQAALDGVVLDALEGCTRDDSQLLQFLVLRHRDEACAPPAWRRRHAFRTRDEFIEHVRSVVGTFRTPAAAAEQRRATIAFAVISVLYVVLVLGAALGVAVSVAASAPSFGSGSAGAAGGFTTLFLIALLMWSTYVVRLALLAWTPGTVRLLRALALCILTSLAALLAIPLALVESDAFAADRVLASGSLDAAALFENATVVAAQRPYHRWQFPPALEGADPQRAPPSFVEWPAGTTFTLYPPNASVVVPTALECTGPQEGVDCVLGVWRGETHGVQRRNARVSPRNATLLDESLGQWAQRLFFYRVELPLAAMAARPQAERTFTVAVLNPTYLALCPFWASSSADNDTATAPQPVSARFSPVVGAVAQSQIVPLVTVNASTADEPYGYCNGAAQAVQVRSTGPSFVLRPTARATAAPLTTDRGDLDARWRSLPVWQQAGVPLFIADEAALDAKPAADAYTLEPQLLASPFVAPSRPAVITAATAEGVAAFRDVSSVAGGGLVAAAVVAMAFAMVGLLVVWPRCVDRSIRTVHGGIGGTVLRVRSERNAVTAAAGLAYLFTASGIPNFVFGVLCFTQHDAGNAEVPMRVSAACRAGPTLELFMAITGGVLLIVGTMNALIVCGSETCDCCDDD